MYTTQKQLRDLFWAENAYGYKRVPGHSQNDYPASVRLAWCEFVDWMAKDKQISEALAQRVTL